MSPDDLVEKFDRAVRAIEDIYRRQDEIWVEWTILQADAVVLARRLDAFIERVPGCLTKKANGK